MRPTLFRQEAVAFSKERSFGEVVLLRPPSSSWLTAGAIMLALAVVAFSFWGEYTRKAHVSGYLVPSKGVIKVYAPGPGTVVSSSVREGQRVRRGDRLLVLSTDHGSSTNPEAQAAAIAQLHERRDSLSQELVRQQAIAEIERRTIEERIASMEQQAVQLRAQIETQRQRVASAQSTVNRYRKLLAQKFVSEAVIQEKQDAVLDQQERSHSLQQNRVSLQRDLAGLKLELDSSALKAKTQREATEREISVLDQQLTEYEARRTTVIAAPADGMVTAILVEEGQNATTSAPLLSILPSGAEL